jgi:hypothetical protein
MIFDLNKENIDSDYDFDVCVIGGGPAGITFALELGDLNLKVCLIESGDLTIKRKNQKLNKARNIGIRYKDLSIQRGRLLGGTSNFWGGNCIPMDPIDFTRTSVREEEWPFKYDTLKSDILKAQKILGIDSHAFGQDILNKVDLPLDDGKDSIFDWKTWQFCDFPFRFGEIFYDTLLSSQNISVILNANLVDFETDQKGQHITFAMIKNLSGKTCRVKATDFALSCGGIENARLMLNFHENKILNIPKEARFIGKNFAEHPNASVGHLIGKNAKKTYEKHAIKYIKGTKEIKPGLGIKAEMREKYGLLNGIISVWPISIESNSVTRAKLLLQLIKNKDFGLIFLVNTFLVLPGIVSLLPHIRHRMSGKPVAVVNEADRFDVRLMSETLPNSDSCVNLLDDLDPLGMRKASLNWRLSNKDRYSFVEIAKLAKLHFEKEDGVELELHDWINDDTKDWTKYINTGGHYGHHMGTTKMGWSASDSVVDQNSKVHSMDNLYILGSSVFPTFGFANPTLTIVALSIKLANFLKKRHSRVN